MSEHTIVYATDFEGDVQGGLALASRLAAERAATLVLVHVVPAQPSDGESLLYTSLDLSSGVQRRLLHSLVPADPSVPYLHVLEIGDPTTQLCAVLTRFRADLLVIEARHRSVLRRMFDRGLTHRSVDQAPCPVVTYREEHTADAVEVPTFPVPHNHTAALDALSSMLNARVDALIGWMSRRRLAVSQIAAAPSVRDAVMSLALAQGRRHASLTDERIRTMLHFELQEHLRALGALGIQVTVDRLPLVSVGRHPAYDPDHNELLDQIREQGSAISLPLAVDDDCGTSSVILSGAAIPLPRQRHAILSVSMDARRDFLRILAQPGPAPSAETYAFNRQGVMLSNSRFPHHLRKMGLLPHDADVQTPHRLRVCDPFTDADDPALTRAAADAITGHDGHDWQGYRDYRGVEVIGAWRWVDAYGFGVAAEMDRISA